MNRFIIRIGKQIHYWERFFFIFLIKKGVISVLNRNEFKKISKIRYWEIDSGESHSIEPPYQQGRENLTELLISSMNNRDYVKYDLSKVPPYTYKKEVGPPFVAEFENVTLFGPYGVPITNSGRIIGEIRYNEDLDVGNKLGDVAKKEGFLKLNKRLFSSNTKKAGYDFEAATCLHPMRRKSNIAYGHWLLEILPRLRGIEYYKNTTGRCPVILVGEDIKDWQKSLVEKLGFSDMISPLLGGEIFIKKFVLPMWPKEEYLKSNLEWVSNSLKENTPADFNDSPKNIFVSRQNMSRRKINNFDNFKIWLISNNFEIVEPEKLPIAEQVSLFSNANIVLGVAGSGLSNIILSKNCSLVEIFPNARPNPVNAEVCQIMGNEYHSFFCENNDLQSYHSNVDIPIQEFDSYYKNEVLGGES